MKYKVPKFIDTEDKIVGPLTAKQFGFVGVPALISTFLFFIMPIWLWGIVAAIFIGGGVVVSFARVNGRPILYFLIAASEGLIRPKIYILKTAVQAMMPAPITPEPEPVRRTVKTPKKEKLEPQKPKFELPTPRKGFQTPSFGGVSGLRSWLATSKNAIPKRERPLPKDFGPKSAFNERLEVVRHLSGEREVARRIDYR